MGARVTVIMADLVTIMLLGRVLEHCSYSLRYHDRQSLRATQMSRSDHSLHVVTHSAEQQSSVKGPGRDEPIVKRSLPGPMISELTLNRSTPFAQF